MYFTVVHPKITKLNIFGNRIAATDFMRKKHKKRNCLQGMNPAFSPYLAEPTFPAACGGVVDFLFNCLSLK